MACLVDVIKGMEEFLLCGLLTGNELNIVDEEQVDIAVLEPELLARAFLYRFKKLICKIVALYIGNLR